MPYFINNNILFIHIPKTGGSSVEKYFSKKFNIQLSTANLYSELEILNGHSYQHCTYSEIYLNKSLFNVYFNEEMLIFAVVRNPYERIISELFYQKLIKKKTNPEQVEKILKNYLASKENYDNHKLPQYLFILDIDGNINSNILILKTETLDDDMKKLGFTDFNIHVRKTYRNKLNYYNYLNDNSIKIINSYYDKDFKIFNYKKIDIIEKMENMDNMKNIDYKYNKLFFNILFIYIIVIILYITKEFFLSYIFSH